MLRPMILIALTLCPRLALAAESSGPRTIPATRPEMKKLLEGLKEAEPRLPLRPLTEEEQQRYGGRVRVNNALARTLYLPESWRTTSYRQDPAMTLDYGFTVKLFWIVSRGNNCHYCLGHQEMKLLAAGLDEDTIAALDCEWSTFEPGEQAAMQLARKMTLEPHRVTAADLDALRSHFSDREIVEMVYHISRYNSTNRWTDSLNLPQDRSFRDRSALLDTPTSPRFQNRTSVIVGGTLPTRPPLETGDEVARALDACRTRQPRVALLDEAAAREVLPAERAGAAMPQWFRAMAYFPDTARGRLDSFAALMQQGDLSADLKARIAWVSARHNRAWYSLARARQRLASLGVDVGDIEAIDRGATLLAPAEREALAFAAKLTSAPQSITDGDFHRLREHFADTQVAQIVHFTCECNFFDRFTETLGLPLDDDATAGSL